MCVYKCSRYDDELVASGELGKSRVPAGNRGGEKKRMIMLITID